MFTVRKTTMTDPEILSTEPLLSHGEAWAMEQMKRSLDVVVHSTGQPRHFVLDNDVPRILAPQVE